MAMAMAATRRLALGLLLWSVVLATRGAAQCSHSHHDHDHAHDDARTSDAHAHAHDVHTDAHDHDHGHDHEHDNHGHVQALHGHGHEHARAERSWSVLRQPEELAEERELLEHGFEEEEEERGLGLVHGLTPTGLWIRALGSSLVVSLASLICLSLLPFISVRGTLSRTFVDSLAAFGVGAMLGDAFFHQLPHAFGGGHAHDHGAHDHSHDHDHAHDHGHGHAETSPIHAHSFEDLSVGISVLSGILLFFIVEKIVRKVEELNMEGKVVPFGGHGHSHVHRSHSHAHEKESDKRDEGEGEGEKEVDKEVKEKEEEKEEEKIEKEEASAEQKVVEKTGEKETEKGEEGGKGEAEGEKWELMEVEKEKNKEKENSKDSTLRRRKAKEGVAEGEDEGEKGLIEGEPAADGEEKESEDKDLVQKDVTAVAETETAPHVDTLKPSLLILGYLNLFSDGVHNFTDGMALGAAFLSHGTVGGWSRMLFMLAHELPQEVGDFGILVRSGFGVGKALAFNFLSALMAMAGTTAALMFGGSAGNSSLIEGFTAGGFIYICAAGVIPDMQSQGTSLVATCTQLGSMVVGMGVALVISMME